MPSSSKEGKKIINSWIEEFSSDVNTIVDLGAGNGNYHKLFYSKNNAILRHARWIGIEVWQPYIELYNLNLTFIMECNKKPALDEIDPAVERRINEVEFKSKFVEKDIYNGLTEEEKKNTFLRNMILNLHLVPLRY